MPDNLHKMDESDVKRAYARWAPVYDKSFGLIAEAGRHAAVEQINKKSGTVLEVGVGTGISLPAYKPDLNITGIDLSPAMLEKARQRVTDKNLANIDGLYEMDASKMAFDDNQFDTVVAMFVMTVVPDPVAVMRELHRVCKPGGDVILVNHFSREGGVRGRVEKMLARFGHKLGWRPEFPIETVLICDDLQVIDTKFLRPFGLFTLLRFRKLDVPNELHTPTGNMLQIAQEA